MPDVFYSVRPAGAGSDHDMSTRTISFTSGGTYEIKAGDTITGATSTETAEVIEVTVTSGTWAGGDAAGTLTCFDVSGTFQSENLDVGANSNVATISGDFGSRGTIAISSGTATFSVAQKGDIGVGCYVSSSNVSGYIKEMTDSTHAKIITATGGTHANVSSEALGAIYHPFASLSAAAAGSGALLGYTDLVTNTTNLYWPCYGATADSTSASVSADYTDSSDYTITLYSVTGGTESINNWRHNGVWSDSKFKTVLSSGSGVWWDFNPGYMRVIGIQCDAGTYSWATCMGFSNGGQYHYLDACIIKSSGGANTAGISAYGGITITNSIIYGFSQYRGVTCASHGNSYLYNCTISGCAYGIYSSGGGSATHYISNCAVFNNTDDFYDAASYQSISYCASDDGDGTNAVTIGTYSDIFTYYSNGDFSLKNFTGTGALINAGTTISGMTAEDITGTSRPQSTAWDIGAFEYESQAGVPIAMHHYNLLRSA